MGYEYFLFLVPLTGHCLQTSPYFILLAGRHMAFRALVFMAPCVTSLEDVFLLQVLLRDNRD